MSLMTYSSHRTAKVAQIDIEREMVENLAASMTEAGVRANSTEVINFYVALKSKPLTILYGQGQSGKVAMIQCLARSFGGGDYSDPDSQSQCQMILGHPSAASKSAHVKFLTETQTRFNIEKLLCLIEEAWQPQNNRRVYLACIIRMSPAELLSFFTEIAFQLRHGQLMRLGDRHFQQPIPFPPNLFVVGTMDLDQFNFWDSDLLAKTTVIRWAGKSPSTLTFPHLEEEIPDGQVEFLRSRISSESVVYHKLSSVLAHEPIPFQPLLAIEALLEEHGFSGAHQAFQEAMVYLANAWTRVNNGLFAASTHDNLTIAMDLAIAQTVLPYVHDLIRRSSTLYGSLDRLLDQHFPYSHGFLENL